MLLRPHKMYRNILRNDLIAFVHRAFLELSPQEQFLINWHLDIMAAKLLEVAQGMCRRLIINIPPRHLKSFTASVSFPAWLLGRFPTKKILAVSYAQDLADKLARDTRGIMQSQFYQDVFDTRISQERQAVADFETVEGGGRFATSIGGVVTGRGADIIIVDDPLKADDAISELRRKNVNEWYDNTLRSRLNSQETGAIIIVMQRLHADDLVAHVTANEDWEILSFPALAEEAQDYFVATPYGTLQHHRAIGDVLQPELITGETLSRLRRSMADYNFAAQYQQSPQPVEGNIVKREHLKFYTEQPTQFTYIIQSWDTANKASQLADFSVCTTWGWYQKKLYLLDVYRRKMDFPELQQTAKQLANIWNAHFVLIEDKASGTQLIQQLKAEGFSRAQAAPALDGDKTMRLSVQTARIQGGFVLFPSDATWLWEYLRELTAFPNVKHDDQVDSTVYALAWATERDAKGTGFFDVDWEPGQYNRPYSFRRSR